MRVLVILFCNLAYFRYPDGTVQTAPGWDDAMCKQMAAGEDPRLGDPELCWQDGRYHRGKDRETCKPR